MESMGIFRMVYVGVVLWALPKSVYRIHALLAYQILTVAHVDI